MAESFSRSGQEFGRRAVNRGTRRAGWKATLSGWSERASFTKIRLFKANRRMLRAYLLKESLGQLWNYVYEGAMLNYLQKWIDQLRWQRLEPFQKLGQMLLEHLDGILNYCRIKVPMGVVEAVNGNIKALICRGRGYKDLDYLLLKARHMAATKSESVVLEKAA